jgi:serine phosphatase RsbU (regulator of sigma subunit)
MTDRLQAELAMAKHIEQSLLPPPRPNWPGLDVLCYSASAREVGGDFYAYHHFDNPTLAGSGNGADKKFAIAVGDASGKGMPAALLMAVSLASFQSALDQSWQPAKLLAHLDQTIQPYTRTSFQNCAFCYVEITPPAAGDNRAWNLSVANAGCVPPLVRRTGGAVEWIEVGGTPLGIGLGAQDGYTEAGFALQPGDLVILTSDGVIEAMSAAQEMFGFERLEQAVAGGPDSNAEAIVNHLRTSVDSFIGEAEPHDDLTIVVIQV